MDSVRQFVWWLIVVIATLSIVFQIYQVWAFVDAGPGFTSIQGQELCEVVRLVAKESYGYQQSGRPLPDCHYGEK